MDLFEINPSDANGYFVGYVFGGDLPEFICSRRIDGRFELNGKPVLVEKGFDKFGKLVSICGFYFSLADGWTEAEVRGHALTGVLWRSYSYFNHWEQLKIGFSFSIVRGGYSSGISGEYTMIHGGPSSSIYQ